MSAPVPATATSARKRPAAESGAPADAQPPAPPAARTRAAAPPTRRRGGPTDAARAAVDAQIAASGMGAAELAELATDFLSPQEARRVLHRRSFEALARDAPERLCLLRRRPLLLPEDVGGPSYAAEYARDESWWERRADQVALAVFDEECREPPALERWLDALLTEFADGMPAAVAVRDEQGAVLDLGPAETLQFELTAQRNEAWRAEQMMVQRRRGGLYLMSFERWSEARSGIGVRADFNAIRQALLQLVRQANVRGQNLLLSLQVELGTTFAQLRQRGVRVLIAGDYVTLGPASAWFVPGAHWRASPPSQTQALNPYPRLLRTVSFMAERSAEEDEGDEKHEQHEQHEEDEKEREEDESSASDMEIQRSGGAEAHCGSARTGTAHLWY